MKVLYGRLVQDGRIVLPSTQIVLKFFPRRKGQLSLQAAWSGELQVPLGQCVQAGGPYELVLRDGRKGSVLVCRSATAFAEGTRTRFLGAGPLETA